MMRECVWFVLGVIVGLWVWTPESPEQTITIDHIHVIRAGCGFADNNSLLCLGLGCYRDPDIRQIGPYQHQTLESHLFAGKQLPAYVILEHRTSSVWDVVNITNKKDIHCLSRYPHWFGSIEKYKPASVFMQ
jgi:hypothetical protein